MSVTEGTSKAALWTGRILVWIPSLFILSGGINSLRHAQMVVEGLKQFGFPESLLPFMGTVALLGGLMALIPATEVVGGILLTAYLGAAAMAHILAHQPMQWLAPTAFGIAVWIGLYLKEPRLRTVFPVKR
ncbi:DoxX family protein [Terriglobus tenax]|uniref:DoxX family protein n=1 Tax=Terriglobus tenax TaxID=1111115 RepID=UPI0021E0DE07|nr:DoxX family protein [Terriglobus tenax]